MTAGGLVPERGALFRGDMVRALRADQKTQTRRTITDDWLRKQKTGFDLLDLSKKWDRTRALRLCPYGKVGDRLWVREAMRLGAAGDWTYDADQTDVLEQLETPQQRDEFAAWAKIKNYKGRKYSHARFMPRALSRILLEITQVRIQRLVEISEKDAIAEGVAIPVDPTDCPPGKVRPLHQLTHSPMLELGMAAKASNAYRWAYACLWDEINGNGSYAANPHVFAISFRRITA